MKWVSFKEKLPELGINILCITEDKKIGFLEVNLETRRYMKKLQMGEPDNGQYVLLDFYDTDPTNDDYQMDLCNAEYWAYPHTAKIDTKKNKK